VTKVYVLQHVHPLEDDEEDVKFIGVYSSRENAQAAIARLSQAPGFSDALAGFHIDEYQLDRDHWVEGYSTLAPA
jgi:homoserine kinase type II